MSSSTSHPLRRDRQDDDWDCYRRNAHSQSAAETSSSSPNKRKQAQHATALTSDVNGVDQEAAMMRDPRRLPKSVEVAASCNSPSGQGAFFPQHLPPWSPPPSPPSQPALLTTQPSLHDQSNNSMVGTHEAQHHYAASLDAAISARLEEHRFLILDSVSDQLSQHRNMLAAEIQDSVKGLESRLQQTATGLPDDILTSAIEAFQGTLLSSFEHRINQVERDLGLGIDTMLSRTEGKMTALEAKVDRISKHLHSERDVNLSPSRDKGRAHTRSKSPTGSRPDLDPCSDAHSRNVSQQSHSGSPHRALKIFEPPAHFEPLLKAIFLAQEATGALEPYGDVVSRHLDSLIAQGKCDPYSRLKVKSFGGYIKDAFFHRVARLTASDVQGRAGVAVFEPYWPYMDSLKDKMGHLREDTWTCKISSTDESTVRSEHVDATIRSSNPAGTSTKSPRNSRFNGSGSEEALNEANSQSPRLIIKRPLATDGDGENAKDGSPSKRVREGVVVAQRTRERQDHQAETPHQQRQPQSPQKVIDR